MSHAGTSETKVGTMPLGMLKKLSFCRKGATAVEYGLICALIVLGAMGAITAFGGKVIAMWNYVSNEVTNS